jgi:hypothetical protein
LSHVDIPSEVVESYEDLEEIAKRI